MLVTRNRSERFGIASAALGIGSSLIGTIYRGAQLISDGIKIISKKEKFILGELVERATQSEGGNTSTYLGLPFMKAASFHIFTGEKWLREALSYGEHNNDDPTSYDPEARKLFAPIAQFLGTEMVINRNGPTVKEERLSLIASLTSKKALTAAIEASNHLISNWSTKKSINEQISFCSIQAIGKAVFGCHEIPESVTPLLNKAEHDVFNRDQVSDTDFNDRIKKLKEISDPYTEQHGETILSSPNYIRYLYEKQKEKEKQEEEMGNKPKKPVELKDINPLFGLLVEGNITSIVTGAVLKIASSPEIQSKLTHELKSLKEEDLSVEGYEKLKKLKYLHNIYLECLRYFSPSPPITRYASKHGKIGDIAISPRSYIFILLRPMMFDPKHWTEPEKFLPERHETTKNKLGQYPFVPFSTYPRICPASLGFIEAHFKMVIAKLFMNKELILTSHQEIETIPVITKEPRLHQKYHGVLREISESPNAPLTPSYKNQKVKRPKVKNPLTLNQSGQNVNCQTSGEEVKTKKLLYG